MHFHDFGQIPVGPGYASPMSSSVEKRQRARLARALAEYWAGGAGPTHSELSDVLETLGVTVEPDTKRERVSSAIKLVERQDLLPLVEELLELLRFHGVFDPSNVWHGDDSNRKRLAESLLPYRVTLLRDGTIKTGLGSLVDASTLPDEAAVRDDLPKVALGTPSR